MKPTPGTLSSSIVVLALSLAACGPAERSGSPADSSAAASARPSVSSAAVRVVAREYAFQAPDSIPSGWVSFRFENQGKETHFFVLHRLPEGVTMQRYLAEVVPPFDSAWGALQAGASKAEAGKILGSGLPDWFSKVTEMGGAGLVAPGGSERLTLKLPPGSYLMECYMKNPQRRFHGELGMLRPLTVTGAASGEEPPSADLQVGLSGDGIDADSVVPAGAHTVAVHYREQPQGLVGYDVHLARLEEGQSADDLVPWMDWMNLEGLQVPAPAEFLGGVQEMPTGDTSYFRIDLAPGRYAWISEFGADQGMVKGFTVE